MPCSAWTYTLLLCLVRLSDKQFKPDVLYASLWSAGIAWLAHAAVARVLLQVRKQPVQLAMPHMPTAFAANIAFPRQTMPHTQTYNIPQSLHICVHNITYIVAKSEFMSQ